MFNRSLKKVRSSSVTVPTDFVDPTTTTTTTMKKKGGSQSVNTASQATAAAEEERVKKQANMRSDEKALMVELAMKHSDVLDSRNKNSGTDHKNSLSLTGGGREVAPLPLHIRATLDFLGETADPLDNPFDCDGDQNNTENSLTLAPPPPPPGKFPFRANVPRKRPLNPQAQYCGSALSFREQEHHAQMNVLFLQAEMLKMDYQVKHGTPPPPLPYHMNALEQRRKLWRKLQEPNLSYPSQQAPPPPPPPPITVLLPTT